jgi:hypothetical protein
MTSFSTSPPSKGEGCVAEGAKRRAQARLTRSDEAPNHILPLASFDH